MFAVITVIHIIACLFLIGVVLLQQGKGADMGAVFGGSSQTLFGSSGAGNLLTRMTTAMAIVFMVTSLTLAYGSARRVTTTIFDDAPLPEAPAAAPAPEASTFDGGVPQPEAAPQAEAAPPAPAEGAPQAGAAPQAPAADVAVVEGAQGAAAPAADAQPAAEKPAEAPAPAGAAGVDSAPEKAAEAPAPQP
jgi:preprotein translocase subunit SecG